MSLFNFFKKSASTPGPMDDFWYGAVGGQGTEAGVKVTPDSAMQITAVFACIRILAETVASLPLKIYKKKPDGTKEEAGNHPIAELLAHRPNSWQTSFEFREMMEAHVNLRGNGYAELVPGPRGFVHEIIPLHPDFVKPEVVKRGVIRYEVSDIGGSNKRILLAHEMFHLKGLSLDGITGVSPITYARNAIGLAKATETYGARLFKNGANPTGILSHPAKLGPEALKHLKASWNEAFGGVANSHKTAILEEGMEWKQMSMSSEDAQFLQTRQYQGTEIARIYRVPPHMIGDLTKSSFSNIEQQAIDFVRHTMMPRLIRWEQAISRDMILKPDIYYPQFVVDGLLRGDTKSRYEAYSKAITDGWLTPNEVRAKENLNPLPGLDEPRQQLNMAAVSDEKESPDEEKEEKNDEEKEE